MEDHNKARCDCNPQGERAKIHLAGSQDFATGLLRLPTASHDGMFWPDSPEDIPESLYTTTPQEVEAAVLSQNPHTHRLKGCFFHSEQAMSSEHAGPHFHFEDYV